MKNLFMSLLLCFLAGLCGCAKNTKETQDVETSVDNRRFSVPKESNESENAESEESESAGPEENPANDAESSCDPKGGDGQCFLVPAKEGDCFGCMKGEPQRAVNKETRELIMKSLRNKCMPQVQKFMESNKGKKLDMSNADKSCEHNAAKCSAEGQCVGTKLSEAEFKKRFPQKGGNRPQQGRPQGRPDGNY